MAQAATLLLDATADPTGRGLVVRGREDAPFTVGKLDRLTPLAVAAEGLLRLATLAESVSEQIRAHDDPRVRLAAALLAARAHPLRVGLEGNDA